MPKYDNEKVIVPIPNPALPAPKNIIATHISPIAARAQKPAMQQTAAGSGSFFFMLVHPSYGTKPSL